VSEQLRLRANKLYSEAKHMEALEAYNKSLCFAEKIESKEAAHVFANRSAVYFTMDMELPDQCLENIKLARDAGYPAEMMKKLNKRASICRYLMYSS